MGRRISRVFEKVKNIFNRSSSSSQEPPHEQPQESSQEPPHEQPQEGTEPNPPSPQNLPQEQPHGNPQEQPHGNPQEQPHEAPREDSHVETQPHPSSPQDPQEQPHEGPHEEYLSIRRLPPWELGTPRPDETREPGILNPRPPPEGPWWKTPFYKKRVMSPSSTPVMRANAVYYPNYRIKRGDFDSPASLDYSCITHVFYAFAEVREDGRVLLDDLLDIAGMVDGRNNGCLGSFRHLKTLHPHLKVLLSVGGGGQDVAATFADVAADPLKRDRFAMSVALLVENGKLDGVDIDWEQPENVPAGRNFLSLLAQIRYLLPTPRYLLTAALPAGEWALRHIDLSQANDYLDFLNLMAYDFVGEWSPLTGHQAQLYSAWDGTESGQRAVNYTLGKGFPARKILLGVPAFGRSFLNVEPWSPNTGSGVSPTAVGPLPYNLGCEFTGIGGIVRGNRPDGVYDYKDLPRPRTVEQVDMRSVAAYCIGDDGEFVTYDNVDTVKVKGAWARDLGLGGLFYWPGPADVRQGPKSLIKAGFMALNPS